jgi:hypothetical protein
LRQLLQDPYLAGVRDQKALDALPQVEREAWSRLWSDVADQLQRSACPKAGPK